MTVNVVKTMNYSNNDEQEIRTKMQRAVDYGLDINFAYIDHIPRTQSGKHRFLIQKLPAAFGD